MKSNDETFLPPRITRKKTLRTVSLRIHQGPFQLVLQVTGSRIRPQKAEMYMKFLYLYGDVMKKHLPHKYYRLADVRDIYLLAASSYPAEEKKTEINRLNSFIG